MNTTTADISWEQMLKDTEGTIYKDVFDEGIRFIIMRSTVSLCAYIGVPVDHPLAGFYYDDITVSAHGGLTFSGNGDGNKWPDGYYWYGWDYAHAGDYCFYNDTILSGALKSARIGDKKWTVRDVDNDSWNTIYEFKKLAKFAEKLKAKL